MERRVGYLRRNQLLTAVVDPSIAPPGFDLRRRLWSTLNHFRTGQGRCAANLVRWNQTSDPSCSCGASLQTMLHIVNDCPDMKFPGGLSALHLAEEEAIAWLGMQSARQEEDLVVHFALCTVVFRGHMFWPSTTIFYAPQLYRQVLLRARISYGNSVCLSVRLSVTTRYHLIA